MTDPQERVESALLQLVETFLPGLEDEDESDIEARQDEHVRRAQATIQRLTSYTSLRDRGLMMPLVIHNQIFYQTHNT
jgi:hypothetical protein